MFVDSAEKSTNIRVQCRRKAAECNIQMANSLIFDFDGTIAETIPLSLAAIRAAYADNGLPVPSENSITSNFGANEFGMFLKMAPGSAEALFESYVKEYCALHEKYSPEPFAGIAEILRKTKGAGWKLGLVTGKHPRTAEASLVRYGMRDIFDGVRCGGLEGSVKPENISSLMREWKADPKRAWYVGDVAQDVLDARAAGIRPLCAAWAQTKLSGLSELESLRPEAIFSSVAELGEWVDKMLKDCASADI